jgi:large subunit ribosomal protein L31e
VAEEEAEASEEGEVEAEGIEEEKVEETTEEAEEAAPTEAEEEEKAEEVEEKEEKKKKREEIPEEEIVEERIYTIPLSRAWIAPRKKRAPRAMRMVKAFIEKHMKIETGTKTEEEEEEEGRLVVSEEVNRKLWSRGIEKPPRNIRVRAVKDKEGTVTLYLAEGD